MLCQRVYKVAAFSALLPLTLVSVEPLEGRQVSGPDHRVVPVLPQLWHGRFVSHHQQEPAVQTGEGDADLHRAAVPGPGRPHQGEAERTWPKGEQRSALHNGLSQLISR